MQIQRLDPLDDAAMRRSFEIAWRAEKEDGRPWNSMWTYQETVAILREQTEERSTEIFGGYDDGQMVGAGLVQRSLLDNTDKAWVFPLVEQELRGRGIGGLMLEHLVEVSRAAGCTRMMSACPMPFADREDSGVLRFAARHEFSVANTEVQRVLRLPVDDALLEAIAAASAPHHTAYTLHTFVDDVPEEYLPSYCHLKNQLGLDAPTGAIEYEEEGLTPAIEKERIARDVRMGRSTFVTVAVIDGEAVAHSDLMLPPGQDEVHQRGTLVRRDHRGRRLGAAVKVANLRAMQRDRPERTEIVTENAEVNEQMIGINERLGFEAVAVIPEFLRST